MTTNFNEKNAYSNSSFSNDQPPKYSSSQYPEPNSAQTQNQNYNNMELGFANSNPSTNQPAQVQNANPNDWGNFGSGLTDKVVRIKFIRKVYCIVSVQLLFTFGICLIFTAVDAIRDWMTKTTGGLILYIIS